MVDWIVNTISQYGYLGIALLMFVENIFPPVPSELIMPFAGYVAATGKLSWLGVVVAGLVGSIAGTLPWYWAGRRLGSERLKRYADRHGRWLTVSSDDIAHAEGWFHRHGAASVLFGRLIPAIRTLISAPAGIANMPLASFLLWSAGGTLAWTGLLVALGYLLKNQYTQVSQWLDPVSKIVVGVIVLTYLYRVFTHRGQASGDKC